MPEKAKAGLYPDGHYNNEPDRGSDFAPRESGQTSGRSFGTRKFEKPLKAGKQMTAGVILTGASAHRKCDGCKRVSCRVFNGN
jgi:hypothetical protein